MFKRVTKRVERKEREEALGITEEMKDVLGKNDTDSDESSSSSGGSSSSDAKAARRKRKRGDVEEDSDSDEGPNVQQEEESDEEQEGGPSNEEVNEDAMDEEGITVREALENPVRDKECVICPGKVIKHAKMESVHLESGHHQRRIKRFQSLVKKLSSKFDDIYSDSASLVVKLMNEEVAKVSKGFEKKTKDQQQIESRARKRQEKKERVAKRKEEKLAKKAALASRSRPQTPAEGGKQKKGKGVPEKGPRTQDELDSVSLKTKDKKKEKKKHQPELDDANVQSEELQPPKKKRRKEKVE